MFGLVGCSDYIGLDAPLILVLYFIVESTNLVSHHVARSFIVNGECVCVFTWVSYYHCWGTLGPASYFKLLTASSTTESHLQQLIKASANANGMQPPWNGKVETRK